MENKQLHDELKAQHRKLDKEYIFWPERSDFDYLMAFVQWICLGWLIGMTFIILLEIYGK